jgi:hypothetical protein
MRMAGRFGRRLRAHAKEHRIPVIDCRVNQRKHELAEQHLETTTVTEGVFLILVGRAQAPVWDSRCALLAPCHPGAALRDLCHELL